nr:MAG TPA: hypothetical protein [Caudoviricetes sp.]
MTDGLDQVENAIAAVIRALSGKWSVKLEVEEVDHD